jgi:hypothetical protein
MKTLILIFILALMFLFVLGMYALINVQNLKLKEKHIDELLRYMYGN